MPSHNEISSTEKLLSMIRSDDANLDNFSDTFTTSPSPEKRRSVLTRLTGIFPLKNPITIGVDISSVELKLIKIIRRFSGQKWQLLGQKCVPLPPNISRDSQQFVAFLRSSLAAFCDHPKGINIWTVISSSNVEVRYIQIPKVRKKEIANAVYWTVKKEFSFNEKENLFDFDVQGEVVVKGVTKIAVTAYIAKKEEVERIKTLFSQTGFALSGITIAPFAIQNLLKTGWLPTIDQTTASLYIGYDRSHIDIFSKGSLVLTRSIKAGINSMIESIAEGIIDHKKKISAEMDKGIESSTADISEAQFYDMELSQELLFSLGTGTSSRTEKETGVHLKEEEIFNMILPSVNRLIRQVENTFEHYTSILEGDKVTNICISSGIPFYTPMINHIEEQLGFKVNVIDALDSGKVPFLGAVIPPASISKRSTLGVAVGLALSDNSYTPNLIFTQQDEEKETKITRINRGIFSIFLIIMAVCFGVFWWVGNSADQKKAVITRLKQQIEQYTPLVDQNLLLQMAVTARSNQQNLKISSQKLLPIVIINELSNLTPMNIRLLSITADLGSHVRKSSKTQEKHVVVNGIVSGDPMIREASLVKYIKRLERLPIFISPEVQKKKPESYSVEDDVLHFILKLKLV
ncbi:MAG: pilus assembly protein PilM [Deltaproteobacteria bacterium]|nr:pilus assembly protein PilM [Deltaproteobacteria bacterium]